MMNNNDDGDDDDDVCPSVCLGRACIMIIRCTVHVTTEDLSLCLDSQCCTGQPHTKARPPTPSRLLPFPPGREVGYGCAN